LYLSRGYNTTQEENVSNICFDVNRISSKNLMLAMRGDAVLFLLV
jgi:hypothetical protein